MQIAGSSYADLVAQGLRDVNGRCLRFWKADSIRAAAAEACLDRLERSATEAHDADMLARVAFTRAAADVVAQVPGRARLDVLREALHRINGSPAGSVGALSYLALSLFCRARESIGGCRLQDAEAAVAAFEELDPTARKMAADIEQAAAQGARPEAEFVAVFAGEEREEGGAREGGEDEGGEDGVVHPAPPSCQRKYPRTSMLPARNQTT